MVRSWRSARLNGGGGVNCVAYAPDGSGRLVAGGDNNGPKVSLDGGVTWLPGMGGLSDDDAGQELQSIAVAWSPDASLVWLACKAGLRVSSNGGLDWRAVSSRPAFSHGGDRPRIVGRCIVDDGQGYVYAVDANGAVWRYSGFGADGLGGTLTQIADLSATGTGLALDPTSPTTLYVATRSGMFRLTQIRGSSPSVGSYSGTGAPTRAEEVLAVNEGGTVRLYVAAYGSVKRAAAASLSGSWDTITPSSSGSQWCSIDGYTAGSSTVLVVGAGSSTAVGNGHGQVWHTSNGQAGSPTWTCLTADDANVDFVNAMGGPGGDPWWGYGLRPGATAREKSPNRWIETGATVECLSIDPGNTRRIMGAGQQGCWMFDLDAGKCYPSLEGLHSAVETAFALHPSNPDVIAVTNNDHLIHVTKVAGRNGDWRKNENGTPGGETTFIPVAIEPNGNMWAGFGHRFSNTDGEIYWHADPTTGASWRAMGFAAFAGGKRALGLAVRRTATQVIVLAAVQNGGIARRTFDLTSPPNATSAWSWATQTPFSQMGTGRLQRDVSIAFASDTIAYAFDYSRFGVWRSTDAGLTWTRIWDVRCDAEREGYLACDPDSTGTLYVSIGRSSPDASVEGVWKLTGATSGTVEGGQITRTRMRKPSGAGFADPGPVVAATGGRVGIIDWSDGVDPTAWLSTDGGATFTDVTDDYFRRGTRKVFGALMTPTGDWYVAMHGPSIIVYAEPETGGGGGPPEPLTRRVLAQTASTDNLSSYATEAVSVPEAGRLLVVDVANSHATSADVPTVSGLGLTWQQQQTRTMSASDGSPRRITTLTAVSTGSHSGSITASFGAAQSGCAIHVTEYDGVRASPVVQSAAADWGGTSSRPLVALAPLASGSGVHIASVTSRQPAAWDPEVVLDELYDGGYGSPATGLWVASGISEPDATPEAVGGTNGRWAAIALEIGAAAQSSVGAELSHDADYVVGRAVDVDHDTDYAAAGVGLRLLTIGADDTDGTTYATASVAPTSGAAWWLAVTSSRGDGVVPEAPSVSGAGLTWQQQATIVYADSVTTQTRRLTVFRGDGTPSAGTLTITFAAVQTGASWALVELPGAPAAVDIRTAAASTDDLTVPVTASSTRHTVLVFAAAKKADALVPSSPLLTLGSASNAASNNQSVAAWAATPTDTTLSVASPVVREMGLVAVGFAPLAASPELDHGLDYLVSGAVQSTPGAGRPRRPKLARVWWTVDGAPVDAQDGWEFSSTALGGHDRARLEVPERQARRRGIVPGSVVTAWTDAGEPVWQGTVERPPQTSGGRVALEAVGWQVRARRTTERRLYQACGTQSWTTMDAEPHGYQVSEKWTSNVGPGRLYVEHEAGTAFNTGHRDGWCIWAPDQPISRVAFTLRKSHTFNDVELVLAKARGPSGPLTVVHTLTLSNHPDGSEISRLVDGASGDLLAIFVRVTSAHTPSDKRRLWLTQVRINGWTAGHTDTMSTDDITRDLAEGLGYDPSGIAPSGINALPLDVTDSWGDALDLLSLLDDQPWRVGADLGRGPRMIRQPWEATELVVSQESGAVVDLSPEPIYTRVRVVFERANGRPGEVVVGGPGLDLEPHELPDPQRTTDLAQALAERLLAEYTVPRYAGTVWLPYGERADVAGGIVRIVDWGPAEALVHRIVDVSQTSTGIRLGIRSPQLVSRFLALAELRRARRGR